MAIEALQATLEQGIPLSDVTFCVVDLETTGGSPIDAAITEIGAVTYRGGERLGTFETLIHPGQPIPRFVAHLTGIDDRMVADAPSIGAVLPSFLEFARGAVIVAHNASFDVGFLSAALDRADLEPLAGPVVCTAKLARRVVWPDVPNVRLATLAGYFRTPTQPSHRAFADAQATAEVLHGLLELGGRLGITTLGDLEQAVRARGRPNYGKIRLADDLPRAAGVYLFTGRDGAVLYVGKSKDLRTRVRSYFYGDSRKKIGRLLEQTVAVEGRPCGSELEALLLEARLIREHEPPYNRVGKGWRRYTYLKLDLAEAFPRLKVVREVRGEGEFLGPFTSASRAHLAKEALEEAFPVRRCTRAMGASTRFAPCALAGIGRCPAPCDGRIDPDGYADLVGALRAAIAAPSGLLSFL
ncbi:MAG: DEDD exonuclease domain-containing protein [Actinomycetota bacterium]